MPLVIMLVTLLSGRASAVLDGSDGDGEGEDVLLRLSFAFLRIMDFEFKYRMCLTKLQARV